MLIDFTMSNYKSFKGETVLSASTGDRLSKYKDSNTINIGPTSVLKNLLIFGPNGSGKSNLLSGLRTMQRMILHPASNNSVKLIMNNFKLNDTSSSEDIHFEVSFKRKENLFDYSFTFNNTEITSEILKIFVKNEWKVYFSRNKQRFDTHIKGFEDVENKTIKNRLFLFDAQNNNDKYAMEVFNWFAEDLVFVDNFVEDGNISEMAESLKKPEISKQFLKFLQYADFNISNIDVIEEYSDASRFLMTKLSEISDRDYEPDMVNHIYTEHKVYDSIGDVIGTKKFRLVDESRGTQKVFMIALAFIDAEIHHNGRTILFDEFDDSLHLELSQAMIKIFNSVSNKNQFIITTHELQLLDSDIRVDQMYLVKKDFKGLSSLVSIFDFKDTKKTTRSGISYMKRYMQGRFGATPVIDPEEMLNALTKIPTETGESVNGQNEKL